MNQKNLLLTAALGLILSAVVGQSAPKPASVPISSLPFTVTSPGTYVLTGNMSYTSGASFGAISIIEPIAGPVVVDLKGFTITSDVGDSKACVVISGDSGQLDLSSYPTTVRNGTITKFAEGVSANSVSNIGVTNVVFNQNQSGVSLEFVDSSTVSNCSFNGDVYGGIQDYQSAGENSYNNNTFGVGGGVALYVQSQSQGYGGTPLVLDRCDFAAPSTP